MEEGAPIRLAEDCVGHFYYLEDGKWTISPHVTNLPEGWYLVPPSFVRDSAPLPK